jgi:aldehyde dehydrogenase (NAD+)
VSARAEIDELLAGIADPGMVHIGGVWRPSASPATVTVVDPFTETVIAEVPAGHAADVALAVAAARTAQPDWEATPVADRAAALRRVAAGITLHAERFARLTARDVGTPIEAARATVGVCAFLFDDMADRLDRFDFEGELSEHVLVRHEAIGVVGAITPWNYPLYQVVAKLAPAIAAGCAVVLKPSEIAPLSVLPLVAVLQEAGIPPGVVNLLSGSGALVGEAIAVDDDVDMVSLTGSGRSGARVAVLAAPSVKRVTLELGGKSAGIVLPDAPNIAAIVAAVVDGLCSNAGQTCSAITRLLVPRPMLAAVEAAAVAAVATQVVGDPMDEHTTVGPLVSAAQRDRVVGFLADARTAGVRQLTGADQPPATGYFVSPTVLTDVTNDLPVAREEIFGPVLCLMAYDDVNDAVAIANDSEYGLSGAVWGPDRASSLDVARRLKTGQVLIDGGVDDYTAPFGGYRRSGNGRELGTFGLQEFLEVKALLL